ncbi:MAG: sulfite exporter TauE/SafE family protein [Desulfobacterales bacterium]|nr:sulfite exporter TauE/SafE family protein [Desulfobacterales bacterium]
MLSTSPIYLIFFTSGLAVGFGHCIGMCGPIVISLSLNIRDRSSLFPNLFYNFGRTITYGILGAIMGGAASFTRFTQGIGGIQQGVMIGAGILIVVMGVAMTGWFPAHRLFGNFTPAAQMINKYFKRLFAHQNNLVFLPIGMLLGLLPCGPVYTAMIAAARTGMDAASTIEGILSGAAVMVCFGLGTIPALLILSQISNVRWLKRRDLIYKFGGVLMIGMGIYFVWKAVIF